MGAAQPQADVEVIACGARVLDALGVLGDTVLELNTLGDPESRDGYRVALVEYFTDHLDGLSEDSRERLTRNPLRILDSKDRSEEHTSELQSLMRISYAVFCLKKKNKHKTEDIINHR